MKAICMVIIMLISITVFASEEEKKDYRYYFSNRDLRKKFGLCGSGDDEYYYRMQQKYNDAREKDCQILMDMMEDNHDNKD